MSNDAPRVPNLPSPPPSLLEVVRSCLGDLDDLALAYVEEVRAIQGYPESAVSSEDLRETAVASLELLLCLIGGLPLRPPLARLSETIGQRRAQQGVPIESLLRAVRMDFRILWTVMLQRVPPQKLAEFTRGAVTVWEAVEFHTIGVHTGYLNERASMAREREQERAYQLNRLLSANVSDQQLLARTARALGVAPDSAFLIVIPADAGSKDFRAAAARANALTSLYERDGAQMLLLEFSSAGRPAIPRWLEQQGCVVSPPAPSLADVPLMWRVAADIAACLTEPPSAPVSLNDAWMKVAAVRLGELGTVLSASVLDGLKEVSEHEAGALVETVRGYFRFGTVSATAAHLYCHRNTVLNRLARFQQLTGRDATKPLEAAYIQTALACQPEKR